MVLQVKDISTTAEQNCEFFFGLESKLITVELEKRNVPTRDYSELMRILLLTSRPCTNTHQNKYPYDRIVNQSTEKEHNRIKSFNWCMRVRQKITELVKNLPRPGIIQNS